MLVWNRLAAAAFSDAVGVDNAGAAGAASAIVGGDDVGIAGAAGAAGAIVGGDDDDDASDHAGTDWEDGGGVDRIDDDAGGNGSSRSAVHTEADAASNSKRDGKVEGADAIEADGKVKGADVIKAEAITVLAEQFFVPLEIWIVILQHLTGEDLLTLTIPGTPFSVPAS
jgi:hypothetical protein